jgi:hypothetical protein
MLDTRILPLGASNSRLLHRPSLVKLRELRGCNTHKTRPYLLHRPPRCPAWPTRLYPIRYGPRVRVWGPGRNIAYQSSGVGDTLCVCGDPALKRASIRRLPPGPSISVDRIKAFPQASGSTEKKPAPKHQDRPNKSLPPSIRIDRIKACPQELASTE